MIGLFACAGDRATVHLGRTGNVQGCQAAAHVVKVNIPGDGQGLAATCKGTVERHQRSCQGGVHTLGHSTLIGLCVRTGDRPTVHLCRARDIQHCQAADCLVKVRITRDGQGLAATGECVVERHQ